MSVNMYNAERYYDPTAYEALTAIEKEAKKAAFRPIVYICSPFSGDTDRNKNKAQKYCKYAVDSGYIPIAPHLLFPQFMSDDNPSDRSLAIFMDIVLLSKCAQLWVFGSNITKGMGIEIAKAKKKQQPIRYFTEACEEVTE